MDIEAIYGGVAALLAGGLGGWVTSIYQIRKQASHNESVLQLEREKFEHVRAIDEAAQLEQRTLFAADMTRGTPAIELLDRVVEVAADVGRISQPFYDVALELQGLGYDEVADRLAAMHSELFDLAQFLDLAKAVPVGKGDAMQVPLSSSRKTDVIPFDKARTATTRAIASALEELAPK